jgi:hypothetical protein
MIKKTYTKPQVIDFSLEGVTGVGAATCNSGANAASCGSGSGLGMGDCKPGVGASLQCGLGTGTSAACNTGQMPYVTGQGCLTGSGAASNYNIGDTAKSRCGVGGWATIKNPCAAGNTDSMPTS